MVEKQKQLARSAEAPRSGVLEEIHALAEGGLKVDEAHGHGERLGHVVSALEAIEKLVASHLGITSEVEESA